VTSGGLTIVVWWVPSSKRPAAAGSDQHWAVQVERRNGRATDGGQANQHSGIFTPAEMVVPGLCARVVEGSHFACLGVWSTSLRTLLLIAGSAGTPQVLADAWPIGSTRNDVLDAEGNATDTLISVAVAAAVVGIGENLRLELG
jgi:hypothetical protein